MAVRAQIEAAIANEEARIALIEQGAAEQIATIEERLVALRIAEAALTPELETVIEALSAVGINVFGQE